MGQSISRFAMLKVSFALRFCGIFMLTVGSLIWQSASRTQTISERPNLAPLITLSGHFDPVSGFLPLHTTHPSSGQWVFALVDTASTNVTADGSGGWIGATVWSGSAPVGAIGENIDIATGGIHGTDYKLFVQHYIPGVGASNVIKVTDAYTEVTLAPTITFNQFNIKDTSALIALTTDQDNDRQWLVISSLPTAPSVTQIKQLKDSSGGTGSVVYSEAHQVTKIGSRSISTTVPESTQLYGYVMQENDRGLQSTITTLASSVAPPDFVSDWSAYTTGVRMVDSADWTLLRNSSGAPTDHIINANDEVQLDPLPASGGHLILTRSTAIPAIDRFVEVTVGSVPPSNINQRLYAIVKAVDASNYYGAYIQDTTLRMIELVDGVYSEGPIISITRVAENDVLRLEYSSGVATAYINGVELDTFAHTPMTVAGNGGVGFGDYVAGVFAAANGSATNKNITFGDLF